MSSNEDEPHNRTYHKKRKLMQRACDHCRKKKIRCDEPIHPRGKCSKCAEQGIECTFTVEPRKRGLPKGYVEELEHRIKLLEGLVKKLCPDKTLLHSLVYHLDPEYATECFVNTTASESTSSSSVSSLASSPLTQPPADTEPKNDVVDITHKVVSLTLGSNDDPFRDDEVEDDILAERLKLISVNSAKSCRFMGKSSGMKFMETALLLKNKYLKGTPVKRHILQHRRPMFWQRLHWYKDMERPPMNYIFPSSDLILKLSKAYFDHVNLFYPLLHRPTFERAVANNLYLHDEGFGSVLLLVCAVGSRYTDEIDERTLNDGEQSHFSAGWKWYKQVQVIKQSVLDPPTLYDLQLYCLAVHYLTGFCAPEAMWLLAGFGIRLAQDVGVHRRRIPRERLTVEDELWKRAFWVLVLTDRMNSVSLGRPCALCGEYFDLDMPIECDDEFWEHPDPRHRFKQPDGVPSVVTAFNQHLRLSKIMIFSVNTIYSIKTKWWELVLKSDWEQHIVAELDSALNNWIGALPDYLRWDPNRTDDRFFKLSGSLITTYHYVQILIHRSFIRDTGVPSPLIFPSLVICTTAACSCSLVLEHLTKRLTVVYPFMKFTCVTAGIVLLVSIWGGVRNGVELDPKVMNHVEKCKDVLRKAEDRWYNAGALLDVLNEFTSFGEIILPEDDPALLFKLGNTEFLSSDAEEEESAPSLSSQTGIFTSNYPAFEIFPPIQEGQLDLFDQYTETFQPPSIDLGTEQRAAAIFDGALFDGFNPSTFNYSNAEHPSGQMGGNNVPSRGVPENGHDSYISEHLDSNMNIASPIDMQQTLHSNTMAMWLNGPNGFQLNEWNSFVAGFTALTSELNNENQDASEGI
ncbi:fungal-specific transcription factor domain-containing protein [Cyathus striatus]|nr:fungal-specific transcription factor domain-containing protein [Cyathus striatus]